MDSNRILQDLALVSLKEKAENFRKILEIFYNWYIFFWTLNITAIVGVLISEGIEQQVKFFIEYLFVFINLLAIAACIEMLFSMTRIKKDTLIIINQLINPNEQTEDADNNLLISTNHFNTLIPNIISYGGVIGCLLSLVGLCIIWIYFRIK